MIFQAESVLLSYFVLGDFMWRSYADYQFHSGS